MKSIKYYSMAALVATAGLAASCSSDDEAANTETVFNNSPITMEVSADDGSSVKTRIGLNTTDINDATDPCVKFLLYNDDILWAYSLGANYFNKLVPSLSEDDLDDSDCKYSSEGATKFASGGDALLLLYGGDKESQANREPGDEAVDITNGTYTLKRTSNSHNIVYIHGNGDGTDGIGRPYSDAKNTYSFRAAYIYINDNAKVKPLEIKNGAYSGSGSAINLISYMPKLLFSLPAGKGTTDERENEVNNYLAKLDYKIIIDAVSAQDEDLESGYPDEVKFKIMKNKTQESKTDEAIMNYQRCFYPDETNPVTTGKSLKLYYKASAKRGDADVTSGNWEPSSWLWHTNSTDNKYDPNNADDFYAGFIFFPVAPAKYKLVRVRVNVSCPDETIKDKVSSLLGTYEYSSTAIDLGFNKTSSDHKDVTNMVYNLGSIWDESRTAISSSSNAPRLAPAQVKAGKGWTKVDDADFDF